jgi:catechol 2,3-dioxygenase-like lactoylglutathione lyase family enzyme
VAGFPGGKLNHVNPILNVSDLRASVDFYTRIVGFELYHTFGDPADFAIVGRDGEQVYLCERGQGSAGTWLALFVADQVALYERLRANGVTVLMPYDGSGGEFRVEDPDGHVLRVFS